MQIDLQLLVFERRLRDSRPDFRQTLRLQTLKWVAFREYNRVPKSSTDEFILMMLNILERGETSHVYLSDKRYVA